MTDATGFTLDNLCIDGETRPLPPFRPVMIGVTQILFVWPVMNPEAPPRLVACCTLTTAILRIDQHYPSSSCLQQLSIPDTRFTIYFLLSVCFRRNQFSVVCVPLRILSCANTRISIATVDIYLVTSLPLAFLPSSLPWLIQHHHHHHHHHLLNSTISQQHTLMHDIWCMMSSSWVEDIIISHYTLIIIIMNLSSYHDTFVEHA